MKYIQVMIFGLMCVMPMQASDRNFLMDVIGTAAGFFIGSIIDNVTPEHLRAPAIMAAQKAKIATLEKQAACQKVEIVGLKSTVDGLRVKLESKKTRRASV